MSSMATMSFALKHLKGLVQGRSVVEIGAGGCKRGLRDLLMRYAPNSYTGVDLIEGPRVDLVADLTEQPSRIPKADVVVCMEVLEHDENWGGGGSSAQGADEGRRAFTDHNSVAGLPAAPVPHG